MAWGRSSLMGLGRNDGLGSVESDGFGSVTRREGGDALTSASLRVEGVSPGETRQKRCAIEAAAYAAGERREELRP
eukprot:5196801-Prymnesium_polylepis.1